MDECKPLVSGLHPQTTNAAIRARFASCGAVRKVVIPGSGVGGMATVGSSPGGAATVGALSYYPPHHPVQLESFCIASSANLGRG
jgi:hypothetical protein